MSSSETVISVQGVSKRFEIYGRPIDQLKQFVLPKLQKILGGKSKTYFQEFWALADVNLTIRKGQACGIIGLNGSGKSTLLQIIAGTLTPTAGKIATSGRVFALLELGAGFSPDFSGRENAYLNGAVLGFPRAAVDAKIESIEAFADIGDHFDRELRTYSSGMQMRVAFAVATAFDPDILIIDEALAVGDAYFQQKCFQKLDAFMQGGGTLLFVSHDANTIKQLCDTAVLVSHGIVSEQDSPKVILDRYHGLIAQMSDKGSGSVSVSQSRPDIEADTTTEKRGWSKASTIVTNDQARLLDIKLLNARGEQVGYVESESKLSVEYSVEFLEDVDKPAFGIIVRDKLGRSIFETSSFAMNEVVRPAVAGEVRVVRFTFDFNLRAGDYFISIGVANRGFARSEFEQSTLLMHDVEKVTVVSADGAIHYGGIYNMKPSFSEVPMGRADA
jgi:ABC-type polysaccharide/polyol phosphate transport system ATPase subunit